MASTTAHSTRRSLWFTGPARVEVRAEPLGPLPADQVTVQSRASLISPGTEMLLFRGEMPEDLPVDSTLPAFDGERFAYPLKYGYYCVGEVTEVGRDVPHHWKGRTVFTFHPHESSFHAPPGQLTPLPAGIDLEDALFLPLVETAVNLVQDARPLLGERVAVIGLGTVGLLTTALLASFPLAGITVMDPIPGRRALAEDLGADETLGPAELAARDAERGRQPTRCDLTLELSGQPDGLNEAIALTGDGGRIVIGSWYGTKPAALDLGGRFHRSRIRLLASQVSSIDPALSGRWTHERRLEEAWRQLRQLRPSRFLTHRLSVERAADAYTLLADDPAHALAVALTYTHSPDED